MADKEEVDALLDRLLAGRRPAEIIGRDGLLDTLTDGGYGIALLWPFSDTRFFAPWQPIPVSPIGSAYLSKRGLMVFVTELLYCVPLLIYGFWPTRKR